MARGDRRLLTGQQLAQEIKVRELPGDPGLRIGRQALAFPDLPGVMSLQNLSGWMGKTGPSFSSPDEVRSPSPRGGWGQGARSGVRVCVPWDWDGG